MDNQKLAIEYATKAKKSAEDAVNYALKAGERLIQVKKELPHGEFGTWIEANMPVTHDRCIRYMNAYQYTCLEQNTLQTCFGSIEDMSSAYINHKRALKAPKKEEVSSHNKKTKAKPITKENLYEKGEKTYNDDDYMSSTEAENILGLNPLTKDVINMAFKLKAKTMHPDKGGSTDEFNKLVKAKNTLLRFK